MSERQLMPRLKQDVHALAPCERPAKNRAHGTLGGKSPGKARRLLTPKKGRVHTSAKHKELFLRNPCSEERIGGASGRNKQQVRQIVLLQALLAAYEKALE